VLLKNYAQYWRTEIVDRFIINKSYKFIEEKKESLRDDDEEGTERISDVLIIN